MSGVAIALAGMSSGLMAAEIKSGPQGGRLLDAEPRPVEFFVNAERKAEVRFYTPALQPVPPAAEVVSITAEPAGGRVVLELEKSADGFVSKQPLPEGEPYRLVVHVRSEPGARPTNYRVDLNTETCGECSHPEYACTCEGH